MRLLTFLAVGLLSASALASGFTPAPGVTVQDEGTSQGRAPTLNCTGAGITCSVVSNVATLNVPGGVGSANTVEVSINFGTSGGLVYSATVTGQAWVTATSIIVCSPFATTADGQTVETYYVSGFTLAASTRVVGVGFDLGVSSPRGATGTFRFHCTGA